MMEYEDSPINAIMRCFRGIRNVLIRKGWIKPKYVVLTCDTVERSGRIYPKDVVAKAVGDGIVVPAYLWAPTDNKLDSLGVRQDWYNQIGKCAMKMEGNRMVGTLLCEPDKMSKSISEMLQVVSPDTLRCNLSGVGEVTTDTNEVTDLVINRIDVTV